MNEIDENKADRLLSISEVAKYLMVSVSTVRRMIDEATITPIRCRKGGAFRFDRHEVMTQLKEAEFNQSR